MAIGHVGHLVVSGGLYVECILQVMDGLNFCRHVNTSAESELRRSKHDLTNLVQVNCSRNAYL